MKMGMMVMITIGMIMGDDGDGFGYFGETVPGSRFLRFKICELSCSNGFRFSVFFCIFLCWLLSYRPQQHWLQLREKTN